MSVALADLVTRLAEAVPAYNGIPSAAQTELAVKDAVADLSGRRSLRKRAGISVTGGIATYDLPADFVSLIRLESLLAEGQGVLNTPQGLIPVPDTFREKVAIAGGHITFYPTPTYTATRVLWYRSGHTVDESDSYPDLTDSDARLALLKAQAICLGMQANKAAQAAWQYAIGDERVSKEKLAEALAKRAEALEQEYLQAVTASVGPVGLRPYR